jgi:SAM-dependent methyltransferase
MPYTKLQAVREFQRWSRGYDRCILQNLLFAPSHRAIIARLGVRTNDRALTILDVGCGTGQFASRIMAAAPRASVWGVDLVPGMLAQGRCRWQSDPEHVAAALGDSERLPFPSTAFDIVTCANSFHHYPRQSLAVAEMHRVLKPGGKLLLVDGCRDGLWGRFIYDACVARLEGGVHHASAEQTRELFENAGFVETSQAVYPGLAPFLLTEGVARGRVTPVGPVHAEWGGARRNGTEDR